MNNSIVSVSEYIGQERKAFFLKITDELIIYISNLSNYSPTRMFNVVNLKTNVIWWCFIIKDSTVADIDNFVSVYLDENLSSNHPFNFESMLAQFSDDSISLIKNAIHIIPMLPS